MGGPQVAGSDPAEAERSWAGPRRSMLIPVIEGKIPQAIPGQALRQVLGKSAPAPATAAPAGRPRRLGALSRSSRLLVKMAHDNPSATASRTSSSKKRRCHQGMAGQRALRPSSSFPAACPSSPRPCSSSSRWVAACSPSWRAAGHDRHLVTQVSEGDFRTESSLRTGFR